MILVGRYRSPFTRRVAVSLRLLGLDYEHRPLNSWDAFAEIQKLNPLARIPVLIVDGGEVLFDSHAILDYVDQLVGPDRALTPPAGNSRRRVMRLVSLALGITDKVVAVVYERAQHSPERVSEDWIARCETQARSGLAALEAEQPSPWLVASRLTQADITTTVMHDFIRLVNPNLIQAGAYPGLDGLAARCAELPAFRDTVPEQ